MGPPSVSGPGSDGCAAFIVDGLTELDGHLTNKDMTSSICCGVTCTVVFYVVM